VVVPARVDDALAGWPREGGGKVITLDDSAILRWYSLAHDQQHVLGMAAQGKLAGGNEWGLMASPWGQEIERLARECGRLAHACHVAISNLESEDSEHPDDAARDELGCLIDEESAARRELLTAVYNAIKADGENETVAYQHAVQEAQASAVTDRLLDTAHTAHDEMLAKAVALAHGDIYRSEFDIAHGDALAAMAALFDRLRPAQKSHQIDPPETGDQDDSSQFHHPGSKAKRSAGPHTAMPKAIAALVEYHRNTTDGSLRTDPIVARELARNAGVSPGTVSDLWKRHFGEKEHKGSYVSYCNACRGGLIDLLLKIMEGELRAGPTLAVLREATDQILELP
jgi:hypothetical protein